MNATWRSVWVGSAVALILLGFGALELAGDRVRVEQVSTASPDPYDEPPPSWQAFLTP
jgi:hypothetical protein